MARTDVALIGAEQLMRRLDMLRGSTLNRVMRPAINRALTPIARAAKQKCPKESGALRRSIGKKTMISRHGVIGMVGPRTGEQYTRELNGKKRVPDNYAHLVEYGHGGPGPAPAHPFLRPALDENRARSLAIVANVAEEKFDQLAAKARQVQ